MRTHTLTEMTNLIADARQLPRGEWPQLHRAHRNWWNKGLLSPADLGGSDSEPARFDSSAVSRALLFGVLADMGYDVATLRKASDAMNEMVEYRRTDGAIYSKRGLDVAIDGIRNGEPWYLHLQLKGGATGIRHIVGGFQRTTDDTIDPVAAAIIADHDAATGVRALGHVIIPARELMSPLLAMIPADEPEVADLGEPQPVSREDEPHTLPAPPKAD